jgi:hypothetical protein
MGQAAERIIRGAIAGLAATGPMTIFMVLAHRRLPRSEQYELPPATITDSALRRLGLAEQVPAPSQEALSVVNHFAYGATTGALYGLLDAEPRGAAPNQPRYARAIAFAIGIWTGSYLGWLPAARVHRSALREPPARNALMLAAHVVWGAGLALAGEHLKLRNTAMKENTNATDTYTIIHKVEGRPPETIASGLNLEQARRWLAKKAAEEGSTVSRDLVIGKSARNEDAGSGEATPGESWHAAKAE